MFWTQFFEIFFFEVQEKHQQGGPFGEKVKNFKKSYVYLKMILNHIKHVLDTIF